MRNEELQMAEHQEKEEARFRAEQMKQYLKAQMDQRAKKAEDEYKAELEEATRI